MDPSLLVTKFHTPSTPRGVVQRARLTRKLDESLGSKLTLVSAPAGYGKTTLVTDWLRGIDRPLTWLSLDERDNDAATFLRYLVGALQRMDPAIGRKVQGALEAPELARIPSEMVSLFDDISATDTSFILVLDGCHVIHDARVHEATRLLMERLPSQMHLAISYRQDPPQ